MLQARFQRAQDRKPRMAGRIAAAPARISARRGTIRRTRGLRRARRRSPCAINSAINLRRLRRLRRATGCRRAAAVSASASAAAACASASSASAISAFARMASANGGSRSGSCANHADEIAPVAWFALQSLGETRGDPGEPGFGPQAAQRDLVELTRAMAAATPRTSPPAASGCLSSASSGTGANCSAAARASSARKRARAACAPAACPRNRRWRCPSATVRPPRGARGRDPASPMRRYGRLSPAPRASATAMASASSRGFAASTSAARRAPAQLLAALAPSGRARHRWSAAAAALRRGSACEPRVRASRWHRRPRRDVGALRAHASQQFAQAELRVAGVERLPAFVVHARVEPGQHDRAGGEWRHHLQQFGGRRDRARRSRGDHRRLRRRGCKPRAKRAQQHVAMGGGFDGAFCLEHARPLPRDDVEESRYLVCQCAARSPGARSFSVVRSAPCVVDLVEKTRQLRPRGSPPARSAAARRCASPQRCTSVASSRLPAQRRDRRRQRQIVRAASKTMSSSPTSPSARMLRTQRRAAQRLGKCLAQRARGAPRRHQHQRVGKRQRIGAGARDSALGQGARERNAEREW